jgi:hypothetical protein
MEKNKFGDIREYLECDCYDIEHLVCIDVTQWDEDWPPEFSLQTQARQWRPFHRRVWAALKYIFGSPLVWDGTALNKEKVDKLQLVINEFYKMYADFEAKRPNGKK